MHMLMQRSCWLHHNTCSCPTVLLLLLLRSATPFLLQYAHMDFVWDRNAHHAVDLVDLLYRFAPE
jgi:hypothetical protein